MNFELKFQSLFTLPRYLQAIETLVSLYLPSMHASGYHMRVIMTRTCTFTSMYAPVYRPVDVSRSLSSLSLSLSLSPFARISIRRTRIAARICRYNANKARKHAAHMYRAYIIFVRPTRLLSACTVHATAHNLFHLPQLPARSSSLLHFPLRFRILFAILPCLPSLLPSLPFFLFLPRAPHDLHALFLPPRLFVCLFETIGEKFGPDTRLRERERELVTIKCILLENVGCESVIKFGE